MRVPTAFTLGHGLRRNIACTTGLLGKRFEAWEDGRVDQVFVNAMRLVAALVLLAPGGVLIWIVWHLGWGLYRWGSEELKREL